MQTIEELIALTNDYREQLNAITSFDDRIAQLTAQKDTLYNKVLEQAKVLTGLRVQAGKDIENKCNHCWSLWACQRSFHGRAYSPKRTGFQRNGLCYFPFLGQ